LLWRESQCVFLNNWDSFELFCSTFVFCSQHQEHLKCYFWRGRVTWSLILSNIPERFDSNNKANGALYFVDVKLFWKVWNLRRRGPRNLVWVFVISHIQSYLFCYGAFFRIQYLNTSASVSTSLLILCFLHQHTYDNCILRVSITVWRFKPKVSRLWFTFSSFPYSILTNEAKVSLLPLQKGVTRRFNNNYPNTATNYFKLCNVRMYDINFCNVFLKKARLKCHIVWETIAKEAQNIPSFP
jgi:hypothetical protein